MTPSPGRNRLLIAVLSIVFAFSAGLFQNCTKSKTVTIAENSSSGTGQNYDGKDYQGYGDCGNGVIGITEKIRLAKDGVLWIFRLNCQDLAVPEQLNLSFITQIMSVAQADNIMVDFQSGNILDLVTSPDSQRITQFACLFYNSQWGGFPVALGVSSANIGLSFGGAEHLTSTPPYPMTPALAFAPPDQTGTWISMSNQAAQMTLNPSSPALTVLFPDGLNVSASSGQCYNQPLPSDLHAPPMGRYAWLQTGWGACSQDCGVGVQTQTVMCVDRQNNAVATDESLCTDPKPPTSSACHGQLCH